MGIALGSNFDVQTNLPLDSRAVVADITARDAISSLRRYEGMSVYVIATQKEYTLKGGITNAEWTEAMAQGVTVVNTATDRDAITMLSRYEGMLVYVKDSKITYQMTSGALTNDGWTYYYGVTASDDVGEIITSARDLSDPHEGTLPCDGATLYDATLYTTLAAKFWNSTQSKWKFGGTGTYPTGQFRTPNLKGAFVRGADLGAGRDVDAASRTASGTNGVTGDAVGSYQDEAFKSHTHIQDAHNHTQNPHTHSMNQLADAVGTTGAIGTRVNVSFDQYTNATTATNNPTTATNQNTGGSETRPKNIAVNFFVRYKPSTRGPKGDTGNAINIVADDTARLAIPAGDRFDGYLCYVQSTKKDWQLQGGITNSDWRELGTGGSGSINFITNPDGNAGTTGWTEGSYTAAARPSGAFTASSGASAFAISTTTTTPLGTGTTSFLLTKSSGASRQGRAVETSFALPLSYRAKVLKIEADYIVNSGTFVAGSNSTDSSLIWYCAFSTDGGSTYTVAEPSSFKLLSNSTTISDKFSASIQTPSNATNMKLIAYVAETANSAWVVETIVAVSPSNYVYGTPITAPSSFTPTGSLTTNATYTGFKHQEGNFLVQKTDITFGGTNTQGVININLPPGLTIDTNLLDITSFKNVISLNGGLTIGSTTYSIAAVTNGANNSFRIVFGNVKTDDAGVTSDPTKFNSVDTSANIPAAIASGATLSVTVRVPILGWSSSVQVSDGYDGRVVACSRGANGQSIPTNIYTPINYTTVISTDTVSGWTDGVGYNSTTGTYTTDPSYVIKTSGKYKITANILFAQIAFGVGNILDFGIYRNGTGVLTEATTVQTTTSGYYGVKTEGILDLIAGDVIVIKGFQNSGSNKSLIASGSASKFSIEKLSGSPVISATETVGFRAISTSGESVPTTEADFLPATIEANTHGAYSSATGFIVPISGYYNFRTSYVTSNYATASTLVARIQKQGVNIASKTTINTGANGQYSVEASALFVWCNAGDVIKARKLVTTGTVNMTTSVGDNVFEGFKVK